MFKFETKNALSGIFRLKIGKKNYCDICYQHPRICRNGKNCAKKNIEFETKMPYLGILGRKFEKMLLYLKSASSNLSKCKVSVKIKNP